MASDDDMGHGAGWSWGIGLAGLLFAGCIGISRPPAKLTDATIPTTAPTTAPDTQVGSDIPTEDSVADADGVEPNGEVGEETNVGETEVAGEVDDTQPDSEDTADSDVTPDTGDTGETGDSGPEVVSCNDDQCVIGNVCYANGAHKPDEPEGAYCNPTCDHHVWSPVCPKLDCVDDAHCDVGGICAYEYDAGACFLPREQRCYDGEEQAEGDDWDNGPPMQATDLTPRTFHTASLNPLGPRPPMPGVGDVDWIRWGVSPGDGARASATLVNETGSPLDFCVYTTCGQGPIELPADVTCSANATKSDEVDAPRAGCCIKVGVEAGDSEQTIWAQPKCVEGVLQSLGFARVRALQTGARSCGKYELSWDLTVSSLPP